MLSKYIPFLGSQSIKWLPSQGGNNKDSTAKDVKECVQYDNGSKNMLQLASSLRRIDHIEKMTTRP